MPLQGSVGIEKSPLIQLGLNDSNVHDKTVKNFQEKDRQQLRYLHALDQGINEETNPLESIFKQEEDAWEIDQVIGYQSGKETHEVKC